MGILLAFAALTLFSICNFFSWGEDLGVLNHHSSALLPLTCQCSCIKAYLNQYSL